MNFTRSRFQLCNSRAGFGSSSIVWENGNGYCKSLQLPRLAPAQMHARSTLNDILKAVARAAVIVQERQHKKQVGAEGNNNEMQLGLHAHVGEDELVGLVG
jgi:hypothetical protein